MFDFDLHIIVGIREVGLINYEKIRKPCNLGEPFTARCKIGWTVFGPDPFLKNKPLTRYTFVRLSDEMLERKVDVLLHESFAERPHDFNQAPSINNKMVLENYKNSIKTVDDRCHIELPFKKDYVSVPDNYQYALKHMLN